MSMMNGLSTLWGSVKRRAQAVAALIPAEPLEPFPHWLDLLYILVSKPYTLH